MLGALRLEKHPDKTFIGRIEKGFDFLGFHFSRDGLTVAKATIEKFVARATRLYEQDREEAFASTRFGMYVRRWVGWAGAGTGGNAARGGRRCPIFGRKHWPSWQRRCVNTIERDSRSPQQTT